VWEKEVEALSARVQRLASISRCPELVAVARQHSRKAEHVRVVRTAEPVMVRRRFWRFFRPRRELEEYPDAERKRMKEKKKLVQKQEKEAARARRRVKYPCLYGHPDQYAEPHEGAFGPGTFSAHDGLFGDEGEPHERAFGPGTNVPVVVGTLVPNDGPLPPDEPPNGQSRYHQEELVQKQEKKKAIVSIAFEADGAIYP